MCISQGPKPFNHACTDAPSQRPMFSSYQIKFCLRDTDFFLRDSVKLSKRNYFPINMSKIMQKFYSSSIS